MVIYGIIKFGKASVIKTSKAKIIFLYHLKPNK
jgi:hypothetical protein